MKAKKAKEAKKAKKAKKAKEDVFATTGWLSRKETNPHQVIAEFFSVFSLGIIRDTIKGILLSAYTGKIYNKRAPCDVLFDIKVLESLILAAHLMNEEKRKSPIKIDDSDVLDKKFYYGRHINSTEWDFLPRCLSVKEYKNPYLVFKRFFKYQDVPGWKRDLEEIQHTSLSRYENVGEMNVEILPVYFQLTKLVEAAHLIDVRETTHIHGFLKNKV